jgi:hypothetical protein
MEKQSKMKIKEIVTQNVTRLVRDIEKLHEREKPPESIPYYCCLAATQMLMAHVLAYVRDKGKAQKILDDIHTAIKIRLSAI